MGLEEDEPMPAKSRKRHSKVVVRKARALGAGAKAKRSPATIEPPADAAAHFVRGILVRGEAVRAGQALPSSATHEIVQDQPGSLPTLRRRRFSLR